MSENMKVWAAESAMLVKSFGVLPVHDGQTWRVDAVQSTSRSTLNAADNFRPLWNLYYLASIHGQRRARSAR